MTELFNTAGGVETCYTYSPFGAVTEDGDTTSPIQWSSEFYDSELALVYYNYRSYNPADGRWINRDPIEIEGGLNLYGFVGNRAWVWDVLGNQSSETWDNFWLQWKKDYANKLSAQQLVWAERQLARGCVGVTIIMLGAIPDFKDCYRTYDAANKKQDKMLKEKTCGKNCPKIYSVHFGENSQGDIAKFDSNTEKLTSEFNFSKIRVNPRGGCNFDFGFIDGNKIIHADRYHNPDKNKDGRGDYFPDYDSRESTIFRSTFTEWSEGAPIYYQYSNFNAEIWCVQCDGGNFGQ